MPTLGPVIDRAAARMAWLRLGTAPLVAALGRRLLARAFPRRARLRILLAYSDYPVAYPQFNAFFRQAGRFAARGISFRAVPVHRLDPSRLPPRLDALFLQPPFESAPGELASVLARAQQARPGLRVALFDWFAPTDIRLAEQVEPWVTSYLKKSLLRDRSAYLAPVRGHTNLSDHYGERLGADNPPANWTVPPAVIPKLIAGPSFPTGRTLIGRFEAADAPPDGERPIDLHARIATRGTGWYSAMRMEAAAAVTANFPDLRVARDGRVSHADYMRELEQSKLCFSPFGYGELCWRDFEAIAAGAVLVKPDMSHIESEPDIFLPFETYIPVRWDLTDLDARVRAALADPAGSRRIAARAYEVVRDYLRGPALIELVERLAGGATARG